MDEVNGDGSADLLDDASLEIEFAYHLGDEAIPSGRVLQQPVTGSGQAQNMLPFDGTNMLSTLYF